MKSKVDNVNILKIKYSHVHSPFPSRRNASLMALLFLLLVLTARQINASGEFRGVILSTFAINSLENEEKPHLKILKSSFLLIYCATRENKLCKCPIKARVTTTRVKLMFFPCRTRFFFSARVSENGFFY